MSRLKKVIINVILISVLLFAFLKLTGFYLTPISAYEHSERSSHYGPSEIIHIEDFENNKYILGKYDKWVSCNTVNRYLFFFWHGSYPIGFENTNSKAIEYTWNMSYDTLKIYGIINDEQITKIVIDVDDGITTTITEFYDDLFLFVCNIDSNQFGHTVKGYDDKDNLIYEMVY